MSSYLLLRNNKESGPYSLPELLNFGLKAYDLVWVNGKSAAWRYPSELDELRQHAPQVEEQPFDRFYKKPSEEKKIEEKRAEEKNEPVEIEALPVKEVLYQPRPASETDKKFMPGKSVFVTLPGMAKQVEEKKAVPDPRYEPRQQNQAYNDEPRYEPKQHVATPIPDAIAETIKITENPATAKLKYSQPLDEIKEMYVRTLQDRKSRIARKGFWIKNLKRAAVVAALIGLGVLAGFIIKPRSAKEKALAQQLPQPAEKKEVLTEQSSDQANTATEEQANSQPTQQEITPVKNPQTQEKKNKVSQPAETPSNPPAMIEEPIRKKTESPVSSRKQEQVGDKESYMPSEKNAVTGERTRSVRDNSNAEPTTEEKISYRSKESSPVSFNRKNNLDAIATVSSNAYKIVAFGGIRNLELTVTNHSNAVLDNVIVELQYLKPSEQPLKTENIRFRSIAPDESLTMRIPDTNRGIKVLYKIISIDDRVAGK